MAKFFLIHGAWLGAWTWCYIAPTLISKGHQVIAPDLLGAGLDKTPIEDISLSAYVESLTRLIKKQNDKVILVGHSMAGMIISKLAETIPDKIDSLVYLCAFLPQNKQSLWDIFTNYTNENIQLEFTSDNLSCNFKTEFITNAFFNCCKSKDVEFARSLMNRYQASTVFHEKIYLTQQNYGRIPRSYIRCTKDNAITINMQDDMIKKQPVNYVYSIETDHAPFFSAPNELVNFLILSDIKNRTDFSRM